MSKQIQRTLQECLSKIKIPPAPHLVFPSKTLSSSRSWILRGCKHPRTPSISGEHEKGGPEDYAATLSDIDNFLLENFKSLFHEELGVKDGRGGEREGEEGTEEKYALESPRYQDPLPSEWLARKSPTKAEQDADEKKGPEDFIALLTYSPSPYDDFRRSMLEMIEARVHYSGRVNWDFMEELLFCYINLNEKKWYKYILQAFVDLTVVLRENPRNNLAEPLNKS